jgi:hypothetical protein
LPSAFRKSDQSPEILSLAVKFLLYTEIARECFAAREEKNPGDQATK